MLLRAAFKQRPIRAKYTGRAVKGGLPGRVYLLPHGAGLFFFTIKMHSAKKAFVWRKPLARRVVQKKAYADDVDKKTPFAKIEVRSANCTTKAKGGHSK